jgi:hypothetical protein|tara:strand:- start:527 stop:700 length:174 start_codon:yes stop_codon:yes gene_type:complete
LYPNLLTLTLLYSIICKSNEELEAKLLEHYESKYLSDDGFDPNKILSAKIKKYVKRN